MLIQHVKKITFVLMVAYFFVVFSIPHVFAASVDLQSVKTVSVGTLFSIDITALTDGQSVNSIDLVVDYPEDMVSFSGYKKDGTIVNLWLDPPHEKNGSVYMSGIIPGGVHGLYDPNKKELRPIPLTRLLFTTKKQGTAHFTFSKSQLLKNDGQGTDFPHTSSDTDITITNNPNEKTDLGNQYVSTDTTPPASFTVELVESSFFSKTPAMLVFSAEDTDSGIKEYKMKIGTSDWQDTQNPQPVGNSVFSRIVTIRAYDFAGNYQEENVYIPGVIPFRFFSILCILLLSGILVYKLLKYKP